MNNHLELISQHGWFGINGAKTRSKGFNMLFGIDTFDNIDKYNFLSPCECIMERNGLVSIIYSERSSQNLIPRVSEGV
jgi:hypothetical protein